MAIEFDCPYCTATIRVPDAYGGKEGRCPKCSTRLLVPTVVRPGASSPAVAGQPVNPAAVNPAAPSGAVVPGVDAAGSPADPSSLTFPDPRRPVTTPSKRKGRRRPSRALVIGMPVLGFLILLGIIGYVVTTLAPTLSGDLSAVRINNESVSRALITWSETGLDETQQATLREALRATPEVLTSELMTCRLIGTEDGISVQLTNAASTEWVAIETASDQGKALGLWLRKERNTLNMARVAELHAAVKKYCADKLAQLDGSKVTLDAILIRDDVALNAGGGPLSFATQAVIGKRIIRCAAESEQGQLLVCVPKGTLAFELTGRAGKDGKILFAGRYNVIVNPTAPKPPASSDDETGSDKTKGEMDDSEADTEMSDGDEMKKGDESESMEEPSDDAMSKPEMKEPAMMDGAMSAPVPLMKSPAMGNDMKGDKMMEDEMDAMSDSKMDEGMMDSKKPSPKKKP